MEQGHKHQDEFGIWHKCYHACRHRWYIWLPVVFIFQVFMFPYEHKAANVVWDLPVASWVAEHTGVAEDNHQEKQQVIPIYIDKDSRVIYIDPEPGVVEVGFEDACFDAFKVRWYLCEPLPAHGELGHNHEKDHE